MVQFMKMKFCAFDIQSIENDGMKNQQNVLFSSIPILGEELGVSLQNNFLSTEITPHEASNNSNNNNSHNGTEMTIHNRDLDPISNWKTVSNEEENGMATSAYIGIHVGIGLIGVILNG